MSLRSKRRPDLVETTGSLGTSPLSAQTSADIPLAHWRESPSRSRARSLDLLHFQLRRWMQSAEEVDSRFEAGGRERRGRLCTPALGRYIKTVGKMMNPEHESEEKEVTAQDQAHINEFSRLNVKFHELEDDLKTKQEMLVNLQDSSNEVCGSWSTMLYCKSGFFAFCLAAARRQVLYSSCAQQVMMMLDESEPVKFAVGESYVDLDQEEGACLRMADGVLPGSVIGVWDISTSTTWSSWEFSDFDSSLPLDGLACMWDVGQEEEAVGLFILHDLSVCGPRTPVASHH